MTKQQQLELVQDLQRHKAKIRDQEKRNEELKRQYERYAAGARELSWLVDSILAAVAVEHAPATEDGGWRMAISKDVLAETRKRYGVTTQDLGDLYEVTVYRRDGNAAD